MSSDGRPTLDNLDEQSIGFLFDAVDLGMEYAKQVGDGFTPFATILGKDGSKDIWKLVGDEAGSWSQEEAVALGREKLRELDEDAHCVTLVYDAYFTADGGRTDAVFVEAYELGRPAGVVMCQRYERRHGSVNLIGNPLLLDDEAEALVPPNRTGVEYPNIGPEAKRLALDAIKLGIERAEAGDYRIIPFATILGEDGSRDMWRFVDDEANPTVGGGLDLARQRLLSIDRTSRCVALVWGGDMSDDGTGDSEEDYSPTGAVFVECYELGRPAGVTLVQGYKRWDADSVALSGSPQVLEEPEPLVPEGREDAAGLPHLSPEARDFTLNLLEVGMEYAEESENGFIPFAAILGHDGSHDLWPLVDDEDSPTVDGGVALGRQSLQGVDGSAHCVALVWDGYITLDGERTEAVFVEAYKLGRPASVLMVQRYERHEVGIHRLQVPVLVDEPDPLVPAAAPSDDGSEFPNMSPESSEFTFTAIGIAMGNADSAASGFIPFGLILANDGSRELWRFVDDDGTNPTIEGGVALGRQRFREFDGSARCVALVWDGYAELYGERTEAVYVEAYELGQPAGVLMIQRYDRQDGRLSLIGNPVLYDGETDPLVPPRGQGRSAAFARIQQMAEEQRRRRES
jgi:hypothetical protein